MLFGEMKNGRGGLGDVTLEDIRVPLDCHGGVEGAAEASEAREAWKEVGEST